MFYCSIGNNTPVCAKGIIANNNIGCINETKVPTLILLKNTDPKIIILIEIAVDKPITTIK